MFRNLDIVARRGLRCVDGRGLTIKNCKHPEGAETFVVAKGTSTTGIRLVGNELKLAKTPFRLDEGAPAGAVKLETAGK